MYYIYEKNNKNKGDILANFDNIIHYYLNGFLFKSEQAPPGCRRTCWETLNINGIKIDVVAGKYFFDEGKPRHVLAFSGPIDPVWLQALNDAKLKIVFVCPPYGLCVDTPKPLSLLENVLECLPALISVFPLDAAFCRRNYLANKKVQQSLKEIVCFSKDDTVRIADQLRSAGLSVSEKSDYKIVVGHQNLNYCAQWRGVKLVDELDVPEAVSSALLTVTGVSSVRSLDQNVGFYGSGQIVSVVDTGLDMGDVNDTHPDFLGRVKSIISWPARPSWNTYLENPAQNDGGADQSSGHGTHVAGLAVGSGVKSRGKHQGVASQAELVFTAMEQKAVISSEWKAKIASGFYLIGRPSDLREVYKKAAQQNAYIHVNAWGTASHGQYTSDCWELDDFLCKNPEHIMLFAAGNSATAHTLNDELDAGSLYSPASAKNVIAVGAAEGPVQGVGLLGSWEAFDSNGRRFKNVRTRSDNISGEIDHIALFSSTGPTPDGRIKPDVCFPGTNLVAPKSRATAARGWGLASPMPWYLYMGGTSQATGVGGGVVALLREAWQRYNNKAPSGCALKALLCAGTKPMISRVNGLPLPEWIGGFGRSDIGLCLPIEQTLYDLPKALNTGEEFRVLIKWKVDKQFSAVLCWYDPPGESLINNLNLKLITKDKIFWGNEFVNGQQPDIRNNVERVNVFLSAGEYELVVVAENIPLGPQNFSLCHSSSEQAVRPGSVKLTSIDVEWLNGIGKKRSQRLVRAGIKDLTALNALSAEVVSEILNSSLPVAKTLLAKTQNLLSTVSVLSNSGDISGRLDHVLTQPLNDSIKSLVLDVASMIDKDNHKDILF